MIKNSWPLCTSVTKAACGLFFFVVLCLLQYWYVGKREGAQFVVKKEGAFLSELKTLKLRWAQKSNKKLCHGKFVFSLEQCNEKSNLIYMVRTVCHVTFLKKIRTCKKAINVYFPRKREEWYTVLSFFQACFFWREMFLLPMGNSWERENCPAVSTKKIKWRTLSTDGTAFSY